MQLTQLDTLIYNIETAEIRRQRQKQAEITEQNILQERRKNRAEKERESRKSSPDNKGSNGSSDSDDSSDVPLTDYFYKLRKRNQTAAPSYRFNEYDDLINSAIRHEMDEVKGAGNLGRGKDIATIIDADNEENQEQGAGNVSDAEPPPKAEKKEDEESSGSDIIRPKKIMKRKKKNRKLNNLDVSSEEERGSDEDFKGEVSILQNFLGANSVDSFKTHLQAIAKWTKKIYQCQVLVKVRLICHQRRAKTETSEAPQGTVQSVTIKGSSTTATLTVMMNH